MHAAKYVQNTTEILSLWKHTFRGKTVMMEWFSPHISSLVCSYLSVSHVVVCFQQEKTYDHAVFTKWYW